MPYTDVTMLMTNQADFLELLLGKNQEGLLTTDGEVSAFFAPVERDQQLDMDPIFDPTDDATLMHMAYDTIGNDAECPQAVTEEIVDFPQGDQSQTEILPQIMGNIFQFPPVSESGFDPSNTTLCPSQLEELSQLGQTPLSGDVTVEILDGDITDAESTYSVTVPSTPFTPLSPLSMPPPTPDTASSLDSSYGNVPAFVKTSLKMAIKSKRAREGKGDIKIEFTPPAPETLTEEEKAKRCEKREKNKMAAQKCREKKRMRIDELEAETRDLRKKHESYENEIQKLIDERDRLMDIINVHGQVCPHFRSGVH